MTRDMADTVDTPETDAGEKKDLLALIWVHG